MKSQLLNYAAGTILFFLLLAFMPMQQRDTDVIIKAFIFVSIGICCGIGFRNQKATFFIGIPFLALPALSFMR